MQAFPRHFRRICLMLRTLFSHQPPCHGELKCHLIFSFDSEDCTLSMTANPALCISSIVRSDLIHEVFFLALFPLSFSEEGFSLRKYGQSSVWSPFTNRGFHTTVTLFCNMTRFKAHNF
ncbi:hypothetical protein TNCT_303021 [Trichonephila clavata]|uniref:Uncharacterized protein n=1 Tax=Trichonephila clavata TaxID=2740835 RepID=A0A8X6LI91_TRICU|nr:hypothetical protein TNCT_303021 [Trichonephila clavata]